WPTDEALAQRNRSAAHASGLANTPSKALSNTAEMPQHRTLEAAQKPVIPLQGGAAAVPRSEPPGTPIAGAPWSPMGAEAVPKERLDLGTTLALDEAPPAPMQGRVAPSPDPS